MVVNLLSKLKKTSNNTALPSPLFTSIFHLPHSFSHLMNFYFTSQQVTSGLMPVHARKKHTVRAHSSNIEMKTHKQKLCWQTGMFGVRVLFVV
jgi:hypothetical protein